MATSDPMRRGILRYCMILSMLLFVSVACKGEETLPWQKDFPSAKELALREGKPLFVMMTATWCGPCKMLERETLPHQVVRSALDDFIWVQAFEDKEVEQKYQCNGYPTLVFIDPNADKVFSRTVGYQPVGPFLSNVIKARKAGNLKLTSELESLSQKIFVPSYQTIQKLIADDNPKGLKEYLQPASHDILRSSNFALLKVKIPDTLKPEDIVVLGRNAEHDLPPTGLLCLNSGVSEPAAQVRIIAPGYKIEDVEVPFENEEAVASKVVTLKKLGTKDSVRLSGQVFLPNGKPASGAIVRICNLDWVKTDKKGKYQFNKLPEGEFPIRIEYPGGEIQDKIQLVAGKPMKQDIAIQPAATVGIRWTIQLEEGSTKLTGETVQHGEAYFSVKHARFSLSKGFETQSGSDFLIANDVRPYEKFLSTVQREQISNQPAPQFFFWLFDASGYGNGLHLESKKFDEIEEVGDGKSIDPKTYFSFLRGDVLKAGQVYTVYCCRKKRFAKLEIIELSEPFGTNSSGAKRK